MNPVRKTYNFEISPQSVDFNCRISLSSLTDLLLTAAGYNAEENGFGMRKLGESGLAWVLLRFALEIDYFPLQYETIHVETWIESVGRASSNRNFIISNQEDQVIGYAISTWAMIDHTTRRAQDIHSLENFHMYASGETIPIEKPAKLPETSGHSVEKFRAGYSHIDFNRHVNTMRYVEWISNCFSPAHYDRFQVQRFDVNFISEILWDDAVEVFFRESENNNFQIEINSNDKLSCRAQLRFRS